MHVIHGCLVARPFLLQGVFDLGLSPLMALELAFRNFALIGVKHNRLSILTRRSPHAFIYSGFSVA
jgi:hypothetical protein